MYKNKFCVILLALIITSQVSASARVGAVVGKALHTDIVVYVNNYAIPSYAVNGQSVIVAEDLRNFGFDVEWFKDERKLQIKRNSSLEPQKMFFSKEQPTGTKFADIFLTDIKVYAEGTLIKSYAMNGYTMIPIEELNMLGHISWNANQRALHLIVPGLNGLVDPQPIKITGLTQYYENGIPACIYGEKTDQGYTYEFSNEGCPYYVYSGNGYEIFDSYINLLTCNGWEFEKEISINQGIIITSLQNGHQRIGIASDANAIMIVIFESGANLGKISAECYPGTDLPTYTYVTQRPIIMTASGDTWIGGVYGYNRVEFLTYINFIENYGWRLCEEFPLVNDDSLFTYSYVFEKNGKIAQFMLAHSINQIMITVDK